ncbi:MAG: recombinase A [Planctomycetes bacterium]|nr:recombinase A [Planctomycetota bacterium]
MARRGVRRGLSLVAAPEGWRLDALLGRLAELSGGPCTAVLTLAFGLVREAQQRGEPVVWVTECTSSFFPPDAAAAGVDLAALAVVRLRQPGGMALVADVLLRSGGFGLVVLDLGANAHLAISAQTRLAGLAKKHHAALLCLTAKERAAPSLGSLVSLRAEAVRTGAEEGRFELVAGVLKDKRRSFGWRHREVGHGPDGLC